MSFFKNLFKKNKPEEIINEVCEEKEEEIVEADVIEEAEVIEDEVIDKAEEDDVKEKEEAVIEE